jgi:hypothetical protein
MAATIQVGYFASLEVSNLFYLLCGPSWVDRQRGAATRCSALPAMLPKISAAQGTF